MCPSLYNGAGRKGQVYGLCQVGKQCKVLESGVRLGVTSAAAPMRLFLLFSASYLFGELWNFCNLGMDTSKNQSSGKKIIVDRCCLFLSHAPLSFILFVRVHHHQNLTLSLSSSWVIIYRQSRQSILTVRIHVL